MIDIPCPLCGSEKWTLVGVLRDRLLGIEGEFRLVRCQECSLHYLNPQPSRAELARYYPEEYDPFALPSSVQLSRWQRYSLSYGLRKRCREVTRQKEAGSLLEVGCATGLFLDAMRATGRWRVCGVDVSEPAVRRAREQFGLEVYHGTLHEAALPAASFDAVAMWDVLEHVPNPRETVREVRRVLKPDGVFVLRAPVLDGWDRRLLGEFWAGWDAPRHLTAFSRQTLHTLLSQADLRVLRAASTAGSYHALALGLRFWARGRLSTAGQERLRRTLEALPLRLAAAPFFYLADRLGKSTLLTVIAGRGDEG
jgi:2-polyprenyl-3-methyl-5-hydroxy-6-metoxy-1,4-benzoquinol methylase